MSDSGSLTVIITAVSTIVTAIIPFVAKFSAGKSEAVQAAAMTRQSDVDLLKKLLKACTEDKNELARQIMELSTTPKK